MKSMIVPYLFLVASLGWCTCSVMAGRVNPVSDPIRRQWGLPDFYQKYTLVHSMPVIGSRVVSDAAISEAAWIIERMTEHRPELLRVMASNRVRLAVMAYSEVTTDVPEHSRLRPKTYWDRRARGLGATLEVPTASCAEENLLSFPGDPYSTENICIHEFAHAIHLTGMNSLDLTFEVRLKAAFHSATNLGWWKGTYAATNAEEYWAEGTQSWFGNNRANDADHNDVDTREKLRTYDPPLAALCESVYGNRSWRYQKPMDRIRKDRAHLRGFDFGRSPRFVWRSASISSQARVLIRTTAGEIEVELDSKFAPKTVENFLRYVQAGLYSGGQFFRTVREDNQPTNRVRIAVIQGQANPSRTNEYFGPIAMEKTRDTGLRHVDGTVSLARAEPDSGQDHFFICIGNQPELDFGGKRNPDGQGFAAFGKVVRGMEVVREIHRRPAKEQQLEPPVSIVEIVRLN